MQRPIKSHSSDQKAVAILKGLLLSLWIAVDLIAVSLAVSQSNGRSPTGNSLWAITFIFLVGGTIFSALLCLPSDLGLRILIGLSRKNTALAKAESIKKGRARSALVGGLLGVGLLAAAPVVYSTLPKDSDDEFKRLGRATAEVATKCSKIADLEQKLFRTDEKIVMAECLIQYDQKYVALREKESVRK